MNHTKPERGRHRSLAMLGATIGLLCAAPLLHAQASNTNHGSATGVANASDSGLSNANANGIGSGTAPVPEASTWAAMAAAVATAGIVARRRRVAR